VAVLHEEVDASLFELDGEGCVYGNLLDDGDAFDVELVAGRSA